VGTEPYPPNYFASAAAQSSTAPTRSSLDESLLDHEMTGRGVIALNEPARFEHGPQISEHRRAAAQHDAIGCEIERRERTVVKQLGRR
jgi:hypothetical protein